MHGKLQPHFFNFARSVPGAEIIDDLDLTPEQRRAKKADVFFKARTVITEVKLLETDTAPKIDPIIAPYRDSDEWPMFYGSRPLSKVLEHLRDGKKLHRKIYHAITNSLENIVADANRQIRDTKASFGLPDARGLLVVLNDTIDILDPNVMGHRVAQALLKRTATGKPRFTEIGMAWLLCETHMVPVPGMRGGLLSVLVSNPTVPQDGKLEAFVDELQQRWAAFNRVPLLRAEVPSQNLNDVPLRPAKAKAEPDQMPHHESWRREYRANPYLRRLTKDELLAYGGKLTAEVGKGFLVGNKVPPEETRAGMEKWTHFLEEINFRGIDMRELKPHLAANRSILGV